MFAEAPSSSLAPSISDAPRNERRSSPPIPVDKQTRATLASDASAPAVFHYPPEWEGVAWMATPASTRPVAMILLEAVGRGVLIATVALVVATLISVAMGVAADAAARASGL